MHWNLRQKRRKTQFVIFSKYCYIHMLWKSFLRRKKCCLTIISRNDCRVYKMRVWQRYMCAWKEFPFGAFIRFCVPSPRKFIVASSSANNFQLFTDSFHPFFSCYLSYCFELNERRETKMIYRTLSNPDRFFSWKRFIIFLLFGHTGFSAVKRTLLWNLCNHEFLTATHKASFEKCVKSKQNVETYTRLYRNTNIDQRNISVN